MNNKSAPPQFFFRLLHACGIGLILWSGLGTVIAAPNTAGAPAARALAPAASQTGSSSIPTPAAMYPDIVADGGIHIGSTTVPFNGSANINSTVMVALTPKDRESRAGQPCSFTGSFTLKNVGGGSPSNFGIYSFDAYTWVEQPQGPMVGKISDTGYGVPDMKPGATFSETFGFNLRPGSYVFWLSIDPYQKLKQATPGVKKYYVKLNASCGIGTIAPMRVPAGIKPVTQ